MSGADDDRSLLVLLEHAEAERDAALAALQRAETGARRLAELAAQLAAYRDDYRRRAPGSDGRGIDVGLLRVHRDFMQRLEQAIDQQARQRRAADHAAAEARALLVEREMRVAGVAKLVERRALARHRVAERAEQRSNDEAAMRAAWSARGSLTRY
jgi:flagellar FliJ protein